jgi:hypothetical protein
MYEVGLRRAQPGGELRTQRGILDGLGRPSYAADERTPLSTSPPRELKFFTGRASGTRERDVRGRASTSSAGRRPAHTTRNSRRPWKAVVRSGRANPSPNLFPRRERSFATGLEARRTGWRNKKPRLSLPAQAGFCCEKSGDTYSRAFGTTIGPESLTAVFEMGTGVTFRICSPERNRRRGKASAGSYTNGCGNWRSFGLERVLSQSTWRDFIAKERQSV